MYICTYFLPCAYQVSRYLHIVSCHRGITRLWRNILIQVNLCPASSSSCPQPRTKSHPSSTSSELNMQSRTTPSRGTKYKRIHISNETLRNLLQQCNSVHMRISLSSKLHPILHFPVGLILVVLVMNVQVQDCLSYHGTDLSFSQNPLSSIATLRSTFSGPENIRSTLSGTKTSPGSGHEFNPLASIGPDIVA